MSNPRIPIILGTLVVLVLAFGWYRGGSRAPSSSTPPSPESSAPPLVESRAQLRSRPASLPPMEVAHAGVEPLPEIAPPNLEQLRPERESLYQQLHGETNAVLAEVETALRPFQATDPATVATAWTLANNWGIYSKGESTADQRIEDPEMRKQLRELHRRVLIDAAEQELRAFFGGNLPTEVQSRLESIGRQNSASASVRKSVPTSVDADRKAARHRAAAGEEPTE